MNWLLFGMVLGCTDKGVDSAVGWNNTTDGLLDSQPSSEPPSNAEQPIYEQERDDGFNPNETNVSDNAVGSVVTILMTLSGGWIPTLTAVNLMVNSVAFTTSLEAPNILVIQDDSSNEEYQEDAMNIAEWLQDAGYMVTFLEESENGITVDELEGYHVAILSNPIDPPDDDRTIEVLYQFSQQGYGIVFQGDDMMGSTSPMMEALTRMTYVDGGSSHHGVTIDSNAAYQVRLVSSSILSTGIESTEWIYGNDIDSTEISISEANVVAWTTVEGSVLPEKPVITAFSPQQSIFQ